MMISPDCPCPECEGIAWDILPLARKCLNCGVTLLEIGLGPGPIFGPTGGED